MILGQKMAQPVVAPTWQEAKAVVFHGIEYQIHADSVLRFHESEALIRIISAPARTSKSYSAAAEVISYVQPMEPMLSMRAAFVGVDYHTLKEFDYCWEWLVEKPDLLRACGGRLGHHTNNPQNGNMRIEILWPARDPSGRQARTEIAGKSATNERSLQGEEWSFVVLSEAAEHEERVWTKYLETRFWRAIFPTTPKPKADWIKKLIESGERDESLSIEHFCYPIEANPIYNRERLEQARKLAAERSPTGRAEDDPYFAEQFLGQWVYYTGKVLPFNPARHVVADDSIDLDCCKVFVSIDYGYDHPSAVLFWAVDPRGVHVIFDEILVRRADSVELIERIQDKLDSHGVYADYFTGDPQRPEVASLLNRFGLPVFPINKKMQRDRSAGHRRLVDLLSGGPIANYPGLFVCERCVHTRQEWQNLRYKEGAKDEFSKNALVGGDDLYDAARYGAMTLAQAYEEPEEEDWLHRMRRERLEEQRFRYADSPYPRWAATGVSPYA